MDAVFGQSRFRSEIIWHRSAENLSKKKWRRASETLLYYSKSNKWTWNPPYEPLDPAQVARDYRHEDERGRYKTTACTNNAYRPNMIYEFNGNTRQWRYSRETMFKYENEGLLVYNDKGVPRRKLYLDDVEGRLLTNVWSDIGVLAANEKEKTGYPTQKPQSLARRIIEVSSNPGDLVLDCFAGCAFVPVAAELTGRRWVACDMSPRAWTVVRRQFHKQSDLRIETEGGYTEGYTGVQPDLRPEVVIRVRGPNSLPIRQSDDTPRPMRFGTLPEPTYKQRAVEDSTTIWEAFVEEWGVNCWYCGLEKRRSRRELQLDHIEPNKRDGSNDDCWNRALACMDCNGFKWNTHTPEETMDKALEEKRIGTPAVRAERTEAFERRHQWAIERWDRLKPQMLPI